MTLIISSMCPECGSWQRLKSGKGVCYKCKHDFYDGKLHMTSFVDTKSTGKKLCTDCGQWNWSYIDGSCPNCEHNKSQGRGKIAWNRVITQKEIDIFMNLTPEEMRIRLGEKAKDFVAANDAIRFPPLSLSFDEKLSVPKPIKIETNPYSKEVAIPLSKEEMKKLFKSIGCVIKDKTDELNKCPMCLANIMAIGMCECGFDFDDYIRTYGSFPDYNYPKGGWVFGKDIAYDGSSFNANTIVEKVCKSCEVPNLPKVHARIQELKAIRDIADHYIKVPSDEHMDKLNLLLQAFYPKCIEDDLLIFPTSIPNKIRLEWQIGQYDISLEINMDNLKGYYHCLNLQTERCEEERHMLHDQKSWEILTDRIRWIDRW
jgi:hypothetical protein